MKIIVYTYTDPLLDKMPDLSIWGWEIDKIYQDIGTRKELQQLIDDLSIEPVDFLIIFHLVDLGNDFDIILNKIQIIEKLGTEIICLNQDYKTSQFKIIKDEQNKQNLAQIWSEIKNISHQRTLQKSHAKNRLKILPPPGKAPFGYARGKDSYVINRATAPIIRSFFDRFLLYSSLRDSVRFLANRYKKKITVSTARYWLTHPVYRGDLRYQKQQIIADTHTPIISREEAAQIDRILKSHSRVQPRSASAQYCLAGLVECDECRSNFKITSVTQKFKQQKYLYLTPVNCSQEKRCKSINYDTILVKVIEEICHQFKLISNNVKTPDIEIIKQKIEREIKQKEIIINQLNNLISENILDEQTAQIRNYQLRTDIAQLKTKLAQLPPNNLETIAKNLSLPQFWYDLSEQEKRFYLREFITKIKLNSHHQSTSDLVIKLELYFAPS